MKKLVLSVLVLLTVLFFPGCYREPPFVPEFPVGEVEGYRPVYASRDDASIVFQSPRALVHPGKIYVVSNYLLINEKYEGIHVFNNADPSHPVALGFLRMAGNTEVAVRNQVLYADHLADLVALNVADWHNIRELSRVRQNLWAQRVPPGNGRYFECVDSLKGVVVGWELSTLKDPKCFR
ncbi:hypothetical protein [Chryseolinea lacunae]|uniref:Uncharacterized protein n=1 Tax=Chryseolinea lacunae TaxID=2801331 RepID=A0ABS1KZM9_9BACT|nr:hypothetical protein [Chryseolinea lacunae]MBL0744728.1 hypothetical protein [Chryseolinea lacunae]